MSKTYCLDCGAKLAPGAKFCSECGTEVDGAGEHETGGTDASVSARGTVTETTTTEPNASREEPTTAQERSSTARSETVFCRACGAEILARSEICPECGVGQRGSGSPGEKNPGLAALLSFVLVGAGQLYNGDVVKGIVLMVAEFTLVSLILVTIWFLVGVVFVPILLALWVYAVWDAWDKAEKINRGEYEPSDSF